MNRPLAYLAALILIWYVSLTFGCIMDHQPDEASLENPPTTDELGRSFLAVRCLVPEPTLLGISIAMVVTLAAGYLGLQE